MATKFFVRRAFAIFATNALFLHVIANLQIQFSKICDMQGGITCGAIDEPRKSSKAIDERVIINFRDKNVVIARFRDKNVYR